MKQVYFDNAATTPIREEVAQVVFDIMKSNFGNPSSSHAFGRSSRVLLEQSRKSIAKHLNVSAGEIIFTSGGTEADNLVLKSAVKDLGVSRIITSKIEHHAVLHTVEQLQERFNVEVNYLEINAEGELDLIQLDNLLQNETRYTLVSLMHINNEIGTILNLKQVADLCHSHNALFHTDAVQSVGRYKLDLQNVGVDFLAASAHKFHGPKGVGFAYIKKNSRLRPMILGGEQERGLRAGTENIHSIVGMEKALDLAYQNLNSESKYIKELKAYFIKQLERYISNYKLNAASGNDEKSTYTMVNVQLPIPPEKSAMLLFQLDLKGIACSKGSACQSGSSQKSHVLTEILNKEALEKPSLRFSFSINNTREEVDYVVETLKTFIQTP
ncbi:cysteine desulfurase family protein [Cognatitamlana onchidii]|uniref:cysteine desulfurase family protein n=1 Tax=Cognatitamlana onchidii TaxID=2562860 RepID=UPI0010A6080E|nr:cysteine desulfurase family protein [Algibacter onchidii]